MRLDDLHIDRSRLADICLRHRVTRLEVFGSFAAGSASSDSDLDILVTFEPGGCSGLEFVTLGQELEAVVGRPVDLLTRASVEKSPNKYFRRYALLHTEPLYERAA